MSVKEIEYYAPIKYNNYTAAMYAVSNLGHVKNVKTDRVLSVCERDGNGTGTYLSVNLSVEPNRCKMFYVHRLVAAAFLPNPNNLPEINHKDQNKTNPRLSNLEWCDRRHNMTYGDVVDRIIRSKVNHSPEFICLETGAIYTNQMAAARELGLNHRHVNDVLHGRLKSTGGYHFKWLYQMVEGLPDVS